MGERIVLKKSLNFTWRLNSRHANTLSAQLILIFHFKLEIGNYFFTIAHWLKLLQTELRMFCIVLATLKLIMLTTFKFR